MRLRAEVRKEGKIWSASCPDIFVETSGDTRAEAVENLAWWFKDMLDDKDFEVSVSKDADGYSVFFPDAKAVVGLILSQIRNFSGETLEQVGKRTRRHRSGVKQLESGKHDPGFSKFDKTLHDLGYEMTLTLQKRA